MSDPSVRLLFLRKSKRGIVVLGRVSVTNISKSKETHKDLQFGVLPILANKWCVAVQALELVNNV